ncbi:cob(I)yrinic acid a,c-diamide adenosyltransferase [soil metagenome]
MKIYTRTGDRGETGLFGGQRVRKDHARVEAYGEVDELNAVLGSVASALAEGGQPELVARIRLLQADLFSLGSNLATPSPQDGGRPNAHIPDLPLQRIEEMERWMDDAETELEPLRAFILPGGTEAASRLHLARTVCRRAERRVISLTDDAHIDDGVVIFLNRLSDLLFTWARLANARAGANDIPWVVER